MEDLYCETGPQQGHRYFFRGDTSTVKLFKLHQEHGSDPSRANAMAYENSGCSESCEVYETIVEQ
jgi:hypothetical protein